MYKSIIYAAGLSVAVLGLTSPASAESKPSPYTDCGIGAALFKNDTGATISNVIWDLGTTALTSATASPETCEGFNADAAAFILDSYDRLVEETAKGQGAHLDTLLSILDLDDQHKHNVISSVRERLADVVASTSYLEADKKGKATLYYYSLMDAIKA
jgi:hypothetical protein